MRLNKLLILGRLVEFTQGIKDNAAIRPLERQEQLERLGREREIEHAKAECDASIKAMNRSMDKLIADTQRDKANRDRSDFGHVGNFEPEFKDCKYIRTLEFRDDHSKVKKP